MACFFVFTSTNRLSGVGKYLSTARLNAIEVLLTRDSPVLITIFSYQEVVNKLP